MAFSPRPLSITTSRWSRETPKTLLPPRFPSSIPGREAAPPFLFRAVSVSRREDAVVLGAPTQSSDELDLRMNAARMLRRQMALAVKSLRAAQRARCRRHGIGKPGAVAPDTLR